MKKAIVQVEQVRDCPNYVEGDCLIIDERCQENELATPPKDCPLDDI